MRRFLSFLVAHQAEIKALDGQFKLHIKHPPKRPNVDPAKLAAEIASIEHKRTTTSMSLSSEKVILKQIEKLNRQGRDHGAYMLHQSRADELKKSLNVMRDSIKQKDAAIAELNTGVARLQLAVRLGCKPSDIVERYVSANEVTMPRVIGKARSNMNQLEQTFKVICEVDKSFSRVKVTGIQDNVDQAVTSIEGITLAVDSEIELRSEVVASLIEKKAQLLNTIQAEFQGVHLAIQARQSNKLKMRGKQELIDQVIARINGLDIASGFLTLSSKEIGVVIGKAGANIKELESKHSVKVEILTREEDATDNIRVIGSASDVEKAKTAIEILVFENEVISDFIDVNQFHRNVLLSNAATVMKSIQKGEDCPLKLIGADGDGYYACILLLLLLLFKQRKCRKEIRKLTYLTNAPKHKHAESGASLRMSSNPGSASSRPSTASSVLTIKGTRHEIKVAKELVQAEIDKYESSVRTISVDNAVFPAIVGKGGENIKAIRNSTKATIGIDWEAGKIRLQSYDSEAVEKAESEIMKIVHNNQVELVEVGPTLLPLFLGAMGKPVRTKILDEIGIKFDVVEDSRNIKLKGSKEKIEQAKIEVKTFLAKNYTVLYEIGVEDISLLISGGTDSILKKLSDESNCDTHLNKEASTVRLRGTKENVDEALEKLKKFIDGGDGNVVEDLAVAESVKGKVIGKGGAKLKEIQDSHNIKVQVLQSSNGLRLRGAKENVSEAIREIVVFLASQKVNEVVTVESAKVLQTLSHKGGLFRKLQGLDVMPALKGSNLKLRGYTENVEEAKRIMAEEEGKGGGIFSCRVPLDQCHLSRVGPSDSPHWQRILEASKVGITVTKDAIEVKGTKADVFAVMDQVYAFLLFCLEDLYDKISVPFAALVNCFTPSELAGISIDTSTTIARDFLTSSCTIRTNKGREEIERAKRVIEERLAKWQKLHCVMKVEQWAMPVIIGNKGGTVKKLQEDTGALFQINSDDCTVQIIGDDEEIVEAGRSAISDLISSNEMLSFQVPLPPDSKGTFIGKSGSNIKKFKTKHSCIFEVVDVDKSTSARTAAPTSSGYILVKGKSSDALEAKKAVEKWCKEYEESNYVGSVQGVKREALAKVIGSKGEVIKKLEADFSVRITVARDSSSSFGCVNVKGDKEKVEDAVRAVKEIVEVRKDGNHTHEGGEREGEGEVQGMGEGVDEGGSSDGLCNEGRKGDAEPVLEQHEERKQDEVVANKEDEVEASKSKDEVAAQNGGKGQAKEDKDVKKDLIISNLENSESNHQEDQQDPEEEEEEDNDDESEEEYFVSRTGLSVRF